MLKKKKKMKMKKEQLHLGVSYSNHRKFKKEKKILKEVREEKVHL